MKGNLFYSVGVKNQVTQSHLLSFYFTTQFVEYKVERLEFYEKKNPQQHMGSFIFYRLLTLITKTTQ